MSLIGYETIIFQVDTVKRPWTKLFNYMINIKDFSYDKRRQHSPTAADWLFLLSKLDEITVPVSFSALEMSFLGTDQEELAIILFFYRPCNVQSSVQGMRSMFIMYAFCHSHTHSMFAASGGTRKRIHPSCRSVGIFIYSPSKLFFGMLRSVSANVLLRGAQRDTLKNGWEGD